MRGAQTASSPALLCGLAPGFKARVAAKLVALPGATLELAAGRASIFVDAAGVGARLSAEVHAGPGSVCHERQLAEVARLQLRHEILPADPAPAQKVFRRDQNSTVAALATADSTRETVEVRLAFGMHRCRMACVRGRVEPLLLVPCVTSSRIASEARADMTYTAQ